MSRLTEVGAWVERRLPEILAEHKVPAAAVAIMVGEEVFDTASGVLSKATGVDATTDSVFQIGSITKVWTCSLAMQLVDEGRMDLDAPVRTYLPDFALGDDTAAGEVTVRQLMCHTSGFEGDVFTDTGRGDDCLERYVALLSEVPQLFPPGEMFSYNNAGFCVLGRIVEVLRGKSFDDCVRDHLIAPLQLTHAANGPHEAILHRAAVGHVAPAPGDDLEPAPVWALMRSNAPAGSMLSMRARDLLAFASMHLAGGVGPSGEQVLSRTSARAMQQSQVELPDLGLMGDAWGLGWELFNLPQGTVVGHDGATIGQASYLRMVPEQDVAVVLLTNGENPAAIYAEIVGTALRELAGIELPPLPAPPAPRADTTAVDASRYVGTYASSICDTSVSVDEVGRVWVEREPKGVAKDLGALAARIELVRWRGDTLVQVDRSQGMYVPYAFVGDDGSGRAAFLHTGRADRRVVR